MNVTVLPTAREVAEQVAAAICDLLTRKPTALLGLAAGATPQLTYELLRLRRPALDRASVILLDEYVGLDPNHHASFRAQIRSQLTDPLGLPAERLHTLNGTADDPTAECERFETLIAELGGVDLQLLGLGRNGHIGFNEPGSPHDSRTRLVHLAEQTRIDNAAAFGSPDAVPRQALTQGIGTILQARRLILLATGAHKAAAVAATIEGPIDTRLPASALQRHLNAAVVIDRTAAQLLRAPNSAVAAEPPPSTEDG